MTTAKKKVSDRHTEETCHIIESEPKTEKMRGTRPASRHAISRPLLFPSPTEMHSQKESISSTKHSIVVCCLVFSFLFFTCFIFFFFHVSDPPSSRPASPVARSVRFIVLYQRDDHISQQSGTVRDREEEKKEKKEKKKTECNTVWHEIQVRQFSGKKQHSVRIEIKKTAKR